MSLTLPICSATKLLSANLVNKRELKHRSKTLEAATSDCESNSLRGDVSL